jgi:hypothetical protein
LKTSAHKLGLLVDTFRDNLIATVKSISAPATPLFYHPRNISQVPWTIWQYPCLLGNRATLQFFFLFFFERSNPSVLVNSEAGDYIHHIRIKITLMLVVI